jgi:hypothetical protein
MAGAGARTFRIDWIALAFVLVAVVLYAPGIVWGLPGGTTELRMRPWGSDELAPVGALAQVWHVVFHGGAAFDPRYPLLPYLLQALFIAPALGWLKLTGGLSGFSPEFPYGLTDPSRQLALLTVSARLGSTLMAAVVPAVAYLTLRRLAERRTAVLAGLFVLLLYPLFYYSRTSNVDAGGLMWLALGLWVFAGVVRDGLTDRRAAALGVFAALATATKDQNYAVFVAVGIAAVALHPAAHRSAGYRRAWVAPAVGFLTAIAVYVIASGIAFNPAAFGRHLAFITEHPGDGGSGNSYFSTAATLEGYGSLGSAYVNHLIDSMGLPMLLVAVVGLIVAAVRAPRLLLIAIPVVAVFAGVVVPVRFIRIRFVLPVAYVLAMFAAVAVGAATGWFLAKRPDVALIRRFAAGAAVLTIVAWAMVRNADLTWQMMNDSRYALADWIAENARPGDHIGFYGSPIKLPHLPDYVTFVSAPHARAPVIPASEGRPEFILIVPQQPFEVVHEWNLPPDQFRELDSGEWEYRRLFVHSGPSLFERRPINWVNPPVRLYVRNDVVQFLRRQAVD